MTTLPQTTGARFPRAGLRNPTIPTLAHAGGAAQASGGNSLSLSDVLRVLRANAWLIALCVILALVLGYVINNYVFEPFYKRYTARAVLQVQTPATYDPSVTGANLAMNRELLEVKQKTLTQKMLSPDLWRPLLQNDRSDLVNSAWMGQFKTANGVLNQADAIEAIAANLRVNPNPQTELITAELSAPNAKDAKTVLEAIVTRLTTSEQNDVKTSTSDERQALATVSSRLDITISNLAQAIGASESLLNTSGIKDGSGSSIAVTRQIELQGLISDRIQKQSNFDEADAEYRLLAQQADQGLTPAIVDQMMEMNQSLQRMQMDIDQLETTVASNVALYGPEHRMTKMAQSQLDATKTKVEEKRNSLRVSMSAMIRDDAARKAQAAKAELDAVSAAIAELEKKIGEQNIEYSKLASNRVALDYAKEKKNKYDERIMVIDGNNARQVESRSNVRLYFPIEEPKEMSFPNLKLTLAAAGLLGMGLALGIAFLRELMDTSVRSPRDIAKVGQLNMLGMIPHTDDDPQAAAGELAMIISQEPNSIIAENFRQVRTRLHHAASLDTTRSLLITSPGPGDGKTVVACNIAAGLALNGRKILLVDANFRRPELHRVFGVANDTGFGSVLSQAASAESVIKHTSVPNLDVLPTGPRPANTTELLESQLLTDFIDRQLEEYDHVIFDTGPILLVSETVALAPRVDGVVSVVRARANSRGLLTRMRDALRQLKAEHIGVVLNGVRQHTGGYYARNIKNYYAYQNGKA